MKTKLNKILTILLHTSFLVESQTLMAMNLTITKTFSYDGTKGFMTSDDKLSYKHYTNKNQLQPGSYRNSAPQTKLKDLECTKKNNTSSSNKNQNSDIRKLLLEQTNNVVSSFSSKTKPTEKSLSYYLKGVEKEPTKNLNSLLKCIGATTMIDISFKKNSMTQQKNSTSINQPADFEKSTKSINKNIEDDRQKLIQVSNSSTNSLDNSQDWDDMDNMSINEELSINEINQRADFENTTESTNYQKIKQNIKDTQDWDDMDNMSINEELSINEINQPSALNFLNNNNNKPSEKLIQVSNSSTNSLDTSQDCDDMGNSLDNSQDWDDTRSIGQELSDDLKDSNLSVVSEEKSNDMTITYEKSFIPQHPPLEQYKLISTMPMCKNTEQYSDKKLHKIKVIINNVHSNTFQSKEQYSDTTLRQSYTDYLTNNVKNNFVNQDYSEVQSSENEMGESQYLSFYGITIFSDVKSFDSRKALTEQKVQSSSSSNVKNNFVNQDYSEVQSSSSSSNVKNNFVNQDYSEVQSSENEMGESQYLSFYGITIFSDVKSFDSNKTLTAEEFQGNSTSNNGHSRKSTANFEGGSNSNLNDELKEIQDNFIKLQQLNEEQNSLYVRESLDATKGNNDTLTNLDIFSEENYEFRYDAISYLAEENKKSDTIESQSHDNFEGGFNTQLNDDATLSLWEKTKWLVFNTKPNTKPFNNPNLKNENANSTSPIKTNLTASLNNNNYTRGTKIKQELAVVLEESLQFSAASKEFKNIKSLSLAKGENLKVDSNNTFVDNGVLNSKEVAKKYVIFSQHESKNVDESELKLSESEDEAALLSKSENKATNLDLRANHPINSGLRKNLGGTKEMDRLNGDISITDSTTVFNTRLIDTSSDSIKIENQPVVAYTARAVSAKLEDQAKKLVAANNFALKSGVDNIVNIINANAMPNAAAAAGENESTKFNLWGEVFGAKASEKVGGYNLSSIGFVLGGAYQLTDNILLGAFGGRNFADMTNKAEKDAEDKIGMNFFGLYSKLDLSPKVNVQIKAGGLQTDLSGKNADGKATKIATPSINLFADFRTNYNMQLSSSLGVVATLGFKVLQTGEYDYLVDGKTLYKNKLQNNKFFLVGASVVGKKFAVNQITLSPSLHMFKEFALGENSNNIDVNFGVIINTKDVISKNDGGSFTAGGLLSAEYANSQFNFGIDFVDSNNYRGLVGKLNARINF